MWHKQRSARRLNAAGRNPVVFQVGDTVGVYVPPSAEEAKARGRKAKHISHYRGPGRITKKIGNTGFEIELTDKNGKKTLFERTIANICPWVNETPQDLDMDDPLAGAIESKDPDTEPTSPANPKPHYYNGGASTATFEIGDVAAVKDSAHDDHY